GQEQLLGRAALAGTGENDRALLAAHDHARREGGRELVEVVEIDEPRPVDDARVEEHGDGIDEPGAADALGRGLADGVESEVAALQANAIDGAQRRPHAVTDLRAFEGGAGGGGAGPQMLT